MQEMAKNLKSEWGRLVKILAKAIQTIEKEHLSKQIQQIVQREKCNKRRSHCRIRKSSLKSLDLQAEESFFAQLQNIAWCPVLEAAPMEGVPWREVPQQIAPPYAVWPMKDLWLVSATLAVLDGDCR